MDEKATLVPPERDVLLAVGCGGALLGHCREVAIHAHVEIEAVELVELADAVGEMRPLVLLIAADIYGFDPDEFDALARAVGAVRLLVELTEPCTRFEARLLRALRDARIARSQAASEPVTTRGKRRPSSGIRWTATAHEDVEEVGTKRCANA